MLTGSGCTDPIQSPIPSVAERCWAFSQSGLTVEVGIGHRDPHSRSVRRS